MAELEERMIKEIHTLGQAAPGSSRTKQCLKIVGVLAGLLAVVMVGVLINYGLNYSSCKQVGKKSTSLK